MLFVVIQNPIIPGFHPDPSICRVHQDYYLVNSSFEFLPGIPIFHSNDLIHWKQLGHCLHRPEQMEFPKCQQNAGIFAPTIRYHQGVFYVIATNVAREGAMEPGGSGTFIITAKQPEGPWSLPCWVSQGGIDPSIFWDDDGKAYFMSTMPALREDGSEGNGIYQAQICPDTGELLTESKIISNGCGGRFAEGPHMYKKDEWYYLITAEGGTEFCHMACISRSRSVWGPFDPCPHNPILTANKEHNPEFAGLGHGDLVQAHDGSWWLVYLGHRLTEAYYHHMGRETGIAPVEWVDGWPLVYSGRTPGLEVETKLLPLKNDNHKEKKQSEDIYGNIDRRTWFDGKSLGYEWNFFRTFFDGYSMTKVPGWLSLYGNERTLNDKDTPAFIGRRIDHFEFRAETLMKWIPKAYEEAGLAIAHTPFVHYEFVVALKDGERRPLLRKRIFDMITEQWGAPLSGDLVKLQIIGDRYCLEFYICEENESSYKKVGSGAVKLLSSEVAGGCIGCYIGIYASGNGWKSENAAKYRWFDYEWLPPKPVKARYFQD